MPSRNAPVPPMGEVGIGGAGGAIRSRLDLILGDSGFEKGRRDRLGQVERGLAGWMVAKEPRIKLGRDFRPDREAAGVEAGSDRDAKLSPRRAGLLQPSHRMGGDPLPRSAPTAVDEGAEGEVRRHDRDRRAVRGGDGDPRIACPDEEAVRLAGRRARLDDPIPMHLVESKRAAGLDPERTSEPPAVLEHRALLIADAQADVERRVRPQAHPAAARGEYEAGAGRKRGGRGAPELDRLGTLRGRAHRGTMARLVGAAQAICVSLLAAGCAHGPALTSGAEARSRFLDQFARADTATRGAGMLAVRQDGKGRDGLNTSWAAVRESLAVVAYAGPIRTLDAMILGDSVYLAIRPYELGLAGPVPANAGLGPRGLLFLARPWTFGAPWVRDAIVRAAVDPDREGWRLTGTFDGGDRPHEFALTLSGKGEPKALRVQLSSDERSAIQIRYGPVRRFSSGPLPRWVEWTRGTTRIRLEIEDHAPAKPSQLRRAPAPRRDWTILALDDPRGRDLLRRLLGVGEEGKAP